MNLLFSRFKGTDSTFEGFPERLRHIVSETISNVVVESIVFPAYEVFILLCSFITVVSYSTCFPDQRGTGVYYGIVYFAFIKVLQDAAVESFGDWLTTLVVERENANGVGGGAGKAKVVLIGHRCVHA